MRIAKIYLETTMFNYYFDKDREAHADTVKLFEEIRLGKHEAFTSVYVIDELEKAPIEKRDLMLALITQYNIKILPLSQEAEQLASIYLQEGIIPAANKIDAQHIAVATINDLDIVISLNFKHIVRKKTIELTELVNIRLNYRKIQIYAPMEVVEDD